MELNEELKLDAIHTPPDQRPPQLQHPKIASILDACNGQDSDLLRVLANSEGGLIADELRRQAWPILLGIGVGGSSGNNASHDDEKSSWRSLPPHRDEDQVRLDVDRSFIYYPHDQSQKQLDIRKKELSNLITEVLRRNPYLSYFQGYHDICQVFLLVLSPLQRAPAVARLSSLRIRDFMLPILAPAIAQLRLIPGILRAANPSLAAHLSAVGQPFFALSGTLTMYAHDIQEYGDIARLFDALLARETVFSVYMFAQIVLQRSEELFDTPSDEPEILHSILSKLPKPLDLESLILNTAKLFERYPPESLREWRYISSSSVLKTAREPDQTSRQTLDMGELYFQNQVKEIQRAEQRQRMLNALWAYRKPAGGAVLAVLIGVASIYIAIRHSR